LLRQNQPAAASPVPPCSGTAGGAAGSGQEQNLGSFHILLAQYAASLFISPCLNQRNAIRPSWKKKTCVSVIENVIDLVVVISRSHPAFRAFSLEYLHEPRQRAYCRRGFSDALSAAGPTGAAMMLQPVQE